MDRRLLALIDDFHAAVRVVIEALEAAGVPRPPTAVDWATYRLPTRVLPGDITLRKHGFGCEANGPGLHVDFDFGSDGQIDAFDAYRLWYFAEARDSDYGFADEDELARTVEAALAAGQLAEDELGNVYIAPGAR